MLATLMSINILMPRHLNALTDINVVNALTTLKKYGIKIFKYEETMFIRINFHFINKVPIF